MGFIRYTMPDFQPSVHHHALTEKLDEVIAGTCTRLIVTMPPRHGKSEIGSKKLPAYFLGKKPSLDVICATYNSELASSFGRAVRDQISDESYSNVFPSIAIKPSDRAADRWSTTGGGAYHSAGVGGRLTGLGGSLLLIDDPIKSREDAESKLARDRTWDWYRSVLYTRQAPNAAIVVIQCMTGDTPVLMADGSEKLLRYVSRGDQVVSYDEDKSEMTTSKVLNFANQGPDAVFEIRMKSGRTVKANSRHPFLTGDKRWVRMQDLKVGGIILTVTGAELFAQKASARSQSSARDAVVPTMQNTSEIMDGDHPPSIPSLTVPPTSDTGMGWGQRTMTECSQSRAAFAPYATSLQPVKIRTSTGVTSSAWTIATRQEQSVDYSATTATLQSDLVSRRHPTKSRRLSTG
jgi:hypothetical protein